MALDGRRTPQGGVADPASSCILAQTGDGLGETAADNFIFGTARSFHSDLAISVNFIDAGGTDVTLVCVAGYNPIKVQRFISTGGATIHGLF